MDMSSRFMLNQKRNRSERWHFLSFTAAVNLVSVLFRVTSCALLLPPVPLSISCTHICSISYSIIECASVWQDLDSISKAVDVVLYPPSL